MSSRESQERTEAWVMNLDDQSLGDLEAEESITEERVATQRDISVQQLWVNFQHTAKAIAQLYKDQQGGICLIVPFKNAATSATRLYHDSVQAVSTCMELGLQCGRQTKTREVIEYAKAWKRYIPREDLISFLHGRTMRRDGMSHRARRSRTMPRHQNVDDLNVFKEAVTLDEIHGGLSNMSVGYSRPSHTDACAWAGSEERDAFRSEFCPCRQRKRNPSPEIFMDSPSRKRGRLT